jgi:hypothetical protein
MRAFAIVAAAAVAAAASAGAIVVGTAGASGSSGRTAITISYWDNGQRTADSDTWTLRCNPAGGTLARPAAACAKLAAGGWKLVAPVPLSAICTQIYGGPQVARVVGMLDGRRVFARFTRANGCQIARWNKLTPWLLPAGGVR